MKCERCGKNEATFYYKSSINGKVTELHLCPECAEALGYTESLRSTWRRPLSLFDDDFFSRPFGLLEPLFDGFGTRLLTEFPQPDQPDAEVSIPTPQPRRGLVSDEEQKARRVSAGATPRSQLDAAVGRSGTRTRPGCVTSCAPCRRSNPRGKVQRERNELR